MAAVCALLAGPAADAQAQTAARVTGRVVDQTGAALPGVSVEVRIDGRVATAAITSPSGAYELTDVPTGTASVSFRLINFTSVTRPIRLAAGERLDLDVTLYLSLTADLTVTGVRTFRNLAELDPPPQTLVGIAGAASEGAVTARQLAARPAYRAAEVLEAVPGVVVTQHSGEGKANQYFLRGFNLDHGTDFATSLVGVPMNLPTHAHGQGWLDLNLVIPELVSGVQFRKGPYAAEDGDFSAAGSSQIRYVTALDAPIAHLGIGEDGWNRALGAVSPRVGEGVLLAALELSRNDGPWVRPDDYRRLNGVLRYSRGDRRNGMAITALGYGASWSATDQAPARAVTSGRLGRFEGVDPTVGGRTHQYVLTADLQRSGDRSVTRASGYLQRYGLNLFSNFTYFLDDPVRGDQFEQADRRWVSGGHLRHRRLQSWGSRPVETAVGLQLRHDAIGTVGLFETEARRRLATTRLDRVGQTAVGVYADAHIDLTPRVRSVIGLRGDLYRFNVTAGDPRNAGVRSDALVGPKASLIVRLWRATEMYVNHGVGFHSNDARGATTLIDPATGAPANPVTPLVPVRGTEVGLRTVSLPGIQSTVAVWTLGVDSELVFIGDAGTTDASRPSRRYGIEWSNYVRLRPWLTVDADLAFSRARFTDDDPAGVDVPGAVGRVVSLGLAVEPTVDLFGSLRLRHFGPRPLTERGDVRSQGTTVTSLQAGWRVTPRLSLVMEVFNLLDARGSDIDYFYRSRLPGEPTQGVADVHTHPIFPRTARVSLQIGR